MKPDIHSHLVLEGFCGSGTTGPEVDAEREFESGERSGVNPRLAIDSSTDNGTTDTGATSDLSNSVFIGDYPQFDGQQTGYFGYWVRTLAIGPALTETSRRWPDGTRHSQSIRVSSALVLHSTNGDVTVSPCVDLSKEHSG